MEGREGHRGMQPLPKFKQCMAVFVAILETEICEGMKGKQAFKLASRGVVELIPSLELLQWWDVMIIRV